MNDLSSTPAERLQLLAAYVDQDPANAALLAEAFDAALACGRQEQAESYLVAGERSAPESMHWPARRAHLCMARGELAHAQDLLEPLLSRSGGHPAVLHDLAYVLLLRGDAASAEALLAPRMGDAMPAELAASVQTMWLRACHQAGETMRACAWLRERQPGGLSPDAAGVGSLVAFDEGETSAAARLADAALARSPQQYEALITRGLLALAARDPEAAMASLRQASKRRPGDARALASLGLACLLAGDAAQAEDHLRRAAEASPPHAQTLQALAWARMLLSDHAGALDALRRAVAAAPDAAETHASMALALCMTGDRNAALPHLQRAEQLEADDEMTRLARAVLADDDDPAPREQLLQQLLAQWSPRA
jgi:tetratricopeptide (TPR) repeat protein